MISRRSLITGAAALAIPGCKFGGAQATCLPGLISDTVVRTIPAPPPKPAYLGSYTDPTYATTITRITGDPGNNISVGGVWPDLCYNHYSSDQSFNCDGSLIHILGTGLSGGLFIDGTTYQPVTLAINPPTGGYVKWHASDPHLMYYMQGNLFGTWNVLTGAKTTIHVFPEYKSSPSMQFGFGNANPSNDGNRHCLTATRNDIGAKVVCFCYEISTNTKFPEIVISDIYPQYGASTAFISPGGNYIVIVGTTLGTSKCFNATTGVQVGVDWPADQPSHFDLAYDAPTNGHEVAVGGGRGSPYSGKCISKRLDTGVVTILMPAGGYVSHTSARNNGPFSVCGTPWAALNSHEPGNAPLYDGELTLALHDGSGTVYRLCHHHNNHVSGDYYSEMHASISRDGRRVIFASNWNAGIGRPQQVYVCSLGVP